MQLIVCGFSTKSCNFCPFRSWMCHTQSSLAKSLHKKWENAHISSMLTCNACEYTILCPQHLTNIWPMFLSIASKRVTASLDRTLNHNHSEHSQRHFFVLERFETGRWFFSIQSIVVLKLLQIAEPVETGNF